MWALWTEDHKPLCPCDLQERILEWVDISYFRRSFQVRTEPAFSALAGGFFFKKIFVLIDDYFTVLV